MKATDFSGPNGQHAPQPRLRLGSEAHKYLFCRCLLDTHDPYRPELMNWPPLDEETRGRIAALPIWDVAVATEERASLYVASFAQSADDPLLREAMLLDAFEEARHRLVLMDLVHAYRIEAPSARGYTPPDDAEFAFLRTGYSECIDSVFGFGLFALARRTGFFPPDLIATFETVMQEEGRHILFFVNWVAWWRRNMPWWRRPWFEVKIIGVWLVLIAERISLVGKMDRDARSRDSNFTLRGSRELGVDVSFSDLARLCIEENESRLKPYDRRLLRPRLVPGILRLLIRLRDAFARRRTLPASA
jgi:hypothetical protein